tara:strand:+ start:85 stop:294 length:210 start_codon:yes stop_codon:yes gene_type:complete
MKSGDLIRIVKNDMSLVHRESGPKDNKFFDQFGVVLSIHDYNRRWYRISLPAGIYFARGDSLEVVSERR